MTTGPKGSDLACDIEPRLEHDARARERFLVADGHVVSEDAPLLHQRIELRVEFESGLARLVLNDADALQRHGIAEPGSHRLGKSFLGGEAVRDEQHRLGRLFVAGPLARRQHAPRKALAVYFQQSRDTMWLDHVDADAVDQAAFPIAAR